MNYIRTSAYMQAALKTRSFHQQQPPEPKSDEIGVSPVISGDPDFEEQLQETRLTKVRSNWYERAGRPAQTQKS